MHLLGGVSCSGARLLAPNGKTLLLWSSLLPSMSRNKTGLWLNTSNLPGITDCPATAHKSLCMAQQTSVSTAIAPWNCILEPPTTPTPPPAHNEMSWNRGSLLSHTNGIVRGLIDLVLVGSKQILISYPSSRGRTQLNCLYSRFVDTQEETLGGTLAERCDRDDVKNTFDSFERFVSFFDCCCSFCSTSSSLSGAESQAAGQEVLFQHTPE